ncbi:MAG: type II toxin-antitoxin system RelE/ParE family toxin [Coriobacteriia bacterium]
MTREIQPTKAAQAQFLSALAYIKLDSPAAAYNLRRRAEKELSRLIDFPESGRVVPEYPNLGYREVLVDSYRFFYKPVGDIIWVVGVWHDAQIPTEPADPGGV